MVNNMNNYKLAVILLVTAVMATSSLLFESNEAAGQSENNIAFRFACGSMVGPAHDRKFVPIVADTTLQTGDQLKFLLELQRKCFVYLIYQSSQGDMNMLFPYAGNKTGSNYELLKMYYVPRDDSWFELDGNSGREKFYLIASASRLYELEELFQKEIPGDEGMRKRTELILSQIMALKKQHRTLTAHAERPVSIGGNVRGINRDVKTKAPDMGAVAIEVTAKDFYCRTFTIEHK